MACVCLSRFYQNKRVFFCNNSKGLSLKIEMHCVLYAAETEVLNITSMSFRVKV